ncbi:pickpocket protein 19-like [Ochlerotatus camptorhynchus]|uniref:pickpocket protein 19-like n=1 Tax=Ochlerotatus camptorhynchus TaxID=644619 RepID=UPI0031D61EBE
MDASKFTRLAIAAKNRHLQQLKRTDSVIETIRWQNSDRDPVDSETFRQKLLTLLSIEGLRHVFDRRKHPLERILWAVTIAGAVYGALFIGMYQMDHFYASPTVTQLDKNYRGWIGNMPAATFCFRDRFDRSKAINYIKRNNLSTSDDVADIERILNLFQVLVNVTVSNFSALAPFTINDNDNSLPLTNVDILSVVSAVHPHHEVAINSFDPVYNDLPIKQVITERGICYTLNAPLSRLQATSGVNRDQSANSLNVAFSQKPITCAYSKNQCYMKIDTYESTVSYLLHSPFELATNDVQFAVMNETDELVASYVVLETEASDRLRDLSVKQRSCIFYDEKYQGLEIYTYNLCVMHCRATRALNLCQCKPHFYPFVDGPTCTIGGLRCLANHPSWHDKHSCRCLKPCTEIVYYVLSATKSHWAAEGGIPFKQKASVRWEIVQPKMRIRRDVLFTFEDLLVSFGGGIALFVGKNLFAFAEVPIFLVKEAMEKIFFMIKRTRK